MGIVQDVTGAIMANAVVELTRNASGEGFSVEVDRYGKFLVKSLNPGAYTIRIHAPGFRDYTKPITLASREALEIAATMQIGL